jgi:hypothetical protein
VASLGEDVRLRAHKTPVFIKRADGTKEEEDIPSRAA